MLHFEHKCSIKGLCKVEDARKIGIPHYMSDETKFQEEQRCDEQANAN